MKLYLKLVSGIFGGMVGVTLILYLVWHTLLASSFRDLEMGETAREVGRAHAQLQDRLWSLKSQTGQLASMEASSRAVRNQDSSFLSHWYSSPKVLELSEVHLVLIASLQGRPISRLAVGWPAVRRDFVSFPSSLFPHLAPDKPLLRGATTGNGAGGFLVLPEGVLTVASAPVSGPEAHGVASGVLVMGRFLKDTEVRDPDGVTPYTVTLGRVASPQLSPDMSRIAANLIRSGCRECSPVVEALTDDLVAGYTLIRDLYGNPAIVLRVEMPRVVDERISITERHSLALLVACAMAAGIVVIVILRQLLMRRLIQLDWDLKMIGVKKHLGGRVGLSGNDELTSLGESINRMLEQLETSQAELQDREASRLSEERFRSLVESSPAAVLIEQASLVVFANPAAVQLLGAKDVRSLVGHRVDNFLTKSEDFARQEGRPAGDQVGSIRKLVRLDGQERVVEVAGTFMPYRKKSAFQYVIQDITERKRTEERLYYLAYYDPLTGLPNRHLFNRLLENALEWARQTQEQVVVMAVNLDRFKQVNDTVGHEEGDKLLTGIAEKLKRALRSNDTIARTSGDEFFVLCRHMRDDCSIEQMAQRLLAVFEQPACSRGHEFQLSPSIGISVYPSNAETGEDISRMAYIAMHRAKSNGGNCYHFFEAALGEAMVLRRLMETSLRKAVANSELSLNFQPQVDIQTGRVIAAEALIRWNHPELGWVPPSQFIPIAEETALIIPITTWVLQKACQQLVAWRAAGLPEIRIAVNLSAISFNYLYQQSLVNTVAEVLKEYDVPPHLLELELTESAAMSNIDNTAAVLRKLHDLGVFLAIDDFGTGYAALIYLLKFPIHALKIDRTFVMDVVESADSRVIVEATIAMSHALKLKVVAEGVETLGQLEFLRTLNCDSIQGYLFSKPLPAEVFTQLLTSGPDLGTLLCSDLEILYS